jgi:hypothetical protein
LTGPRDFRRFQPYCLAEKLLAGNQQPCIKRWPKNAPALIMWADHLRSIVDACR